MDVGNKELRSKPRRAWSFVDQGDKKLRDHIKGKGKINCPVEDIYSNLRTNIRRALPQVSPFSPQYKKKIMLLCGGPSMLELVHEIKARRRAGWGIITVNGAHDWALDLGLNPSVQVLLDARPWNQRFVKRPIKECRYLVSSQCHPSVFDALEGYDVWLWHGVAGEPDRKIIDRYYRGRWAPISGGSTVGTRCLYLLHVLGFRNIAVYGLDSCIKHDKHHAFSQPENDEELVHTIRVGKRKFLAHRWMSVQADELLQMLPVMPDDLNLDFRGDNMITHILRCTAEKGRPPKINIVKEGTV
jgi:hypothetical protein